MSEHPTSFRLDARAAGDTDVPLDEHLAACEACRAYVAMATRRAAEFTAHEGACAAEFLAQLDTRRRGATTVRPFRAAWAAVPLLAAAAAVLLVLRVPPRPDPVTNTAAPGTRFKGHLQMAVVRDRAGAQERLATMVAVRPGDRIRVEVGVDDEKPICVGMLTREGAWIVLLAPVVLEAGTHFSERAALFDESPSEGWILAGHPEDVERARMTRVFAEVSVIPVVLQQ